jgi:hypothetical protein
MENDQKTSTDAKPGPETAGHVYDFDTVYANNTRFEASVWDFKVLFGELEQHTGREVVNFHTAVTMPWLQVKLLCYYIRLNLAIHELTGKVAVPPNMLPQPLEPPTPEQSEAEPLTKQLYEIAKAIRADLFG